jgi:repressor LexA
MKTLTKKQNKILEIIKQTLKNEGEAPTVREIAREIRVKSPRAVSHHLEQLEKKGYIRRNTESSRNIVLAREQNGKPVGDVVKVPLCGWTAGGPSILSEENISDWLPISSRFLRQAGGDIFLLRVKGNSMAPKIEDGDMIIVKKQYTAEPGETVVALLGDETTVKKYVPHDDHIVLQPENAEHEPIIAFPDELRIQGVVRGVLKYC